MAAPKIPGFLKKKAPPVAAAPSEASSEEPSTMPSEAASAMPSEESSSESSSEESSSELEVPPKAVPQKGKMMMGRGLVAWAGRK